MESSKDVVVHDAKRAKLRLATADHHGGTAAAGWQKDLISGLCDDVLLRILGLVPDATDAVRTGALSRRWRGLWTRAPALRFTLWPRNRICWPHRLDNAERFIAFASNVLALRAQQSGDAAIEHLKISFPFDFEGDTDQLLRLQSIRAAETWIRCAAQQSVKSFCFDQRLPRRPIPAAENGDEEDEDERDEGPDVMVLDDLPSSEKLETMSLDLDGGCRVRLPSAVVFASLVDLTIKFMKVAAGSGHLLARLLSSDCCPSLQKLCMWFVRLPSGMNELLLENSSLLELTLDDMDDMSLIELRTPSLRVLEVKECMDLEVLVVSAPRLEELMFLENSSQKEDVHNIDIIKGRIPHLDHVTSLNVHISPLKRHSFGDYVARLLSLFRNLAYLCLDFDTYIKPDDQCLGSDFICDHLDHWKSYEISSLHLQKAEFRGLTGTDCELHFFRSVLASARQLQMNMLLGGGTWSDCHWSYERRPCQR
uniref:F-box/LRR-repeat protein 15/At3g58940/PEG3-like LRR domain-containing protein n=1 Tax=Setaria italica TaxID=4555 RepID=K4ALA8_SETIT